MRIGYARVSTHEQNLDLQLDELKKAGCEEIITDKISGAVSERPGLESIDNKLRKGCAFCNVAESTQFFMRNKVVNGFIIRMWSPAISP